MNAIRDRPDLDAARAWLTAWYGSAPGLMHISSSDDWSGAAFDNVDAAVADIKARARRNPQGIYYRCCTLDAPLPPGKRGGADQSLALPGMWSDIDFGTDGHRHAAGEGVLPLPPDEAAAWAVADRSGLPTPSFVGNSGGGLNVSWALREALVVTDENRDRVAALCALWQRILGESARRLSYSYGEGVGDLARVLRMPGTDNLKTGAPRPCRVVYSTGALYTIEQLADAAETNKPAPAPRRETTERPEHDRRIPASRSGAGPFDILAGFRSFDYLLEPAGWSFVGNDHGGELWLRPSGPDGPATSKYSARANVAGVPVLVVHSESAGLPSGAGQRLTPGRVYALLHHRGDERAAAADLLKAAAGDPSASSAARSLPAAVLAAIRTECNVTAWTEPSPSVRPPNGSPVGTLAGLLRSVLHADEADRLPRLRWAADRTFQHAARGLFEAKTAGDALLEVAVVAGIDEAQPET